MGKIYKTVLFVLMTVVIAAGLALPVVPSPDAWYEFPFIPGLGENAKIIFFHVPQAWLTVLAFLMALVYSVRYLKTKDLNEDLKALTSLHLGMIFCIAATLTGAVWAKFAWGSFWHWDPRETSIFALLLIYGALFALRSAVENEERRASLSAVYSIIAFFTVPFFIFIMPRIMAGLHPGSADDTTSGPVVDFNMSGNMMVVFMLSLTAFTLLYFWIWKMGYKSLLIKEKLTKQF